MQQQQQYGRAPKALGKCARLAPASLTSGRASSLIGGIGGGRSICRILRLSGEKDRLGSGGRSTMSRNSCGGVR